MTESRDLQAESAGAYNYRKLTPMLRQYVDAKGQCPKDCILMFRMGDFFELFFDDARIAARELGITLTARDKGDNPIPMAGVPHHAISGYVAKLVERGFSVAMCDQVEDPKAAKGIVRREITRLVTPGTATDLEALDPGQAAYLACALPCATDASRTAFALLDLLAGRLLCTTVPVEALADETSRMGVREILLDAQLAEACAARLRQQKIAVRMLSAAERVADADAFLALRVGTADLRGAQANAPQAFGAPVPQVAQSVHSLHMLSLKQALAAVITFAETTQRCQLTHLSEPAIYDMARFLVLDETTRRNLELFACSHDNRRHGSLLWHLDRCRTSMGSRHLAQWLLFGLRDADAIARRADGVSYFKDARDTRAAVQKLLGEVRDIERLAGRVAVGRATPRDFGAILISLRAMPTLRRTLLEDVAASQAAETSPLKKIGRAGFVKTWQGVDLLESLKAALGSALADDLPLVASDAGIFRRGYTAELDELIMLCTESHAFLADLEVRERARTNIATLKVRYNRVFGYFLEVTRANAAQVPADYIRKQTLVNAERYITPELKSFEEKVLDADARRRTLELSLWESLYEVVRQSLPALRRLAQAVAQVDVLCALAEVAETGRYVRPQITQTPDLLLEQARHPVLERLMPGGERFVPNDLALDAASRQLLIVTGPNMAGKSTIMRQAALCVIMAQMGGFVPAKRAVVGLCDRIFTRVGAADNLGRGHSTFMVEMVETANILKYATPQSLVLLDEIGRGTSTFDGLSIAWAVAEYLHDVALCRGMFATHYHELCALAATHPRIHNASVAIKQEGKRIIFLRHLVAGGASRSYGLEVARLAALPQSVLTRAAVILAGLEADKAAGQTGESPGRVAVPDQRPKPLQSNQATGQPTDPALAAASTPAAPAEDDKAQLMLFCRPAESTYAPPYAAPAAAPASRLLRTLAKLDVNRMTPIEAMAALAKLQQML